MNARLRIVLLTLAFGLTIVAPTGVVPEAEAGPGSLLSRSRAGGKRVHKGVRHDKGARHKKARSKARERGKHRVVERRRTPVTDSHAGATRRTTVHHRTTRSGRRVVVHDRHRHSTSRRRVHHRRRARPGRVMVHHHYGAPVTHHSYREEHYYHGGEYHGGEGGVGVTRSGSQIGGDGLGLQPYLMGSVGVSGMVADQIADLPLPGIDYNLGLGMKSGMLAAELGFNMAGYRLDPAAEASNFTLYGLTADAKLQPSLGMFEPYIAAGLGGHAFQDHILGAGAVGGSLRLGAGADLRFGDVALNLGYTYSHYVLDGGNSGPYDDLLSAQIETVGLGLKLYF